METKIAFNSGQYWLEVLYNRLSGDRGAIITHRHPLYGGDMINPVVETLASAYSRKGYTTLRFNFRGVGGSEGSFDEGRTQSTTIYPVLL